MDRTMVFPSDFPQISIDRFPSEADLGHGRSRAFRSAGAILLPRRAGGGHRLRCGATSELWAGHWGGPEDCLMICFTDKTAGLQALIWVIHGFFTSRFILTSLADMWVSWVYRQWFKGWIQFISPSFPKVGMMLPSWSSQLTVAWWVSSPLMKVDDC